MADRGMPLAHSCLQRKERGTTWPLGATKERTVSVNEIICTASSPSCRSCRDATIPEVSRPPDLQQRKKEYKIVSELCVLSFCFLSSQSFVMSQSLLQTPHWTRKLQKKEIKWVSASLKKIKMGGVKMNTQEGPIQTPKKVGFPSGGLFGHASTAVIWKARGLRTAAVSCIAPCLTRTSLKVCEDAPDMVRPPARLSRCRPQSSLGSFVEGTRLALSDEHSVQCAAVSCRTAKVATSAFRPNSGTKCSNAR